MWVSTKVVDRFSTVLIGGMLVSFFLSTGSLLNSVTADVLLDTSATSEHSYWRYAWAALPVCLASFGFHGNVPPLLACLLFPTGFVKVMGYVGLMAAIWAALVPALLVRASRRRYAHADYRVIGGSWLIGFVIVFAVLVFCMQILLLMDKLPLFKG